jgi:hypothetical protein
MAYNLATAAMATGVNKSTILRSIKAGRISATKNDTGWTIEVAELHRVFPPLPPIATGEAAGMPRDATIDALVQVLRQQVEDMRQERDRWHAAFEASQQQHMRLLPPPATDNAAVGNLEIDRGNRWQRAWRWMQKTG